MFGLIVFLVILFGGVLGAVLWTTSGSLGALAVVALILAVGGISLVGAALSGIYTASLYRYATLGDAGSFGTEAMAAAFSQKKQGRLGGILGR